MADGDNRRAHPASRHHFRDGPGRIFFCCGATLRPPRHTRRDDESAVRVFEYDANGLDGAPILSQERISSRILATWLLSQVGSYLGYTGGNANIVGKVIQGTCDYRPDFDRRPLLSGTSRDPPN